MYWAILQNFNNEHCKDSANSQLPLWFELWGLASLDSMETEAQMIKYFDQDQESSRWDS